MSRGLEFNIVVHRNSVDLFLGGSRSGGRSRRGSGLVDMSDIASFLGDAWLNDVLAIFNIDIGTMIYVQKSYQVSERPPRTLLYQFTYFWSYPMRRHSTFCATEGPCSSWSSREQVALHWFHCLWWYQTKRNCQWYKSLFVFCLTTYSSSSVSWAHSGIRSFPEASVPSGALPSQKRQHQRQNTSPPFQCLFEWLSFNPLSYLSKPVECERQR